MLVLVHTDTQHAESHTGQQCSTSAHRPKQAHKEMTYQAANGFTSPTAMYSFT